MRDREQAGLFAGVGREPLAARMRPRTLDEFIGQTRIIGQGRLLRRAIMADQLSSVIFYGPPGTGKTTLARVIANATKADFLSINAVLAGVKDIRDAVGRAQAARDAGRNTILFVDEVHRFNKAQQDALLPWVENGTVVLIGATTENPYFEVNKALLSRSRVFELEPLTEEELRSVAQQALDDEERGYGRIDVRLEPDALDHLVNVANGDARALLNALELAVETTPPGADGRVVVDREVAEESIQRRAVLYDKEGDAHFDTISAFIKSVRGSDPDAALYWLAKMVYAGEDPRFVLRRLLILASEDVGLADPGALGVVAAAAQAFDYVGLPEGRFHLAQATLYLATAPKSNSTLGFFDALAAVEGEREGEVPDHLKDANRDAEGLGHGAGYLYPHAYRDHWIAQQYLPEQLQGRFFYDPSGEGYEGAVREEVLRRREAQIEAAAERDASSGGPVSRGRRPLVERAADRWLERTSSRAGERLAMLRDALFRRAEPRRDDAVLDLTGGSGLITFEALRRVPNGQVWTVVTSDDERAAIEHGTRLLPEPLRPVIVLSAQEESAKGSGLSSRLAALAAAGSEEVPAFDVVLGRALLGETPSTEALTTLARAMATGGRAVLAQTAARESQRLHALVNLRDPGLAGRLYEAEEAIYAEDADVVGLLEERALEAGFTSLTVDVERFVTAETIGERTLRAWFGTDSASPTYRDLIARHLDVEEVAAVERAFMTQLAGRQVEWSAPYHLITMKV